MRGEKVPHGVPFDESERRSSAECLTLRESHRRDLPRLDSAISNPCEPDVADRFARADRSVDQLLADQGLTGTALEGVQIEIPTPQPRSIAVELSYSSGVDEDSTTLTGSDEANNPWRVPNSTR
jgi:hypothetical protein